MTGRRRATTVLWARVVIVSGLALVSAVAGCGISDGTESFRPPDANIVARASCTLPDIVARFDGRAEVHGEELGEGSIPDGFAPSGVVSCQTSDGPGGTTVIDEVELGGDIDSFVRAVDRPSVRTDANTSVSCAFSVAAPVAIWLVSEAGAIRVAWPRVVCGFRDEPLAALEALTERRRAAVRDLGVLVTDSCLGTSTNFARRSSDGERRSDPDLSLRVPTRAVAGATVCTYRTSRLPTGDLQSAGATARRVTAAAATALLREVTSAPAAPACDTDATEVAVMPLYRPDGSGGASLSVETDGCRRVQVDGGSGYRTASGEITALLRGES